MCTYVCRYRWWLYQILAYCLHFPLYTSFEGSVWIQEVVNSHISSSYGWDRMPASILVCVCVCWVPYIYEYVLVWAVPAFCGKKIPATFAHSSYLHIVAQFWRRHYPWHHRTFISLTMFKIQKKKKSSTHGFVWATEAAEVTAPTSVPKYHSSVLFLQPTISSYPLRISGSAKVFSTSSSHSQYPQYIEQWSYFEK